MTRIYVGNISQKGKTDELHGIFEDCGKIKSFNIKEGSGFIEYETQEEAEEAIKKCNGKTFCDKSLVVEPSRRPIRSRKMPVLKHSHNGSSHHKYSRHRRSSSSSSSSSYSRKKHRRRKHSYDSPKKTSHRHKRHSRSRSRSRSRKD